LIENQLRSVQELRKYKSYAPFLNHYTMLTITKKRTILLIVVIVLIFLGAGLILNLFMNFFPTQNKLDPNDLPFTTLEFTKSIYPQLLDLGKFFLTILVGVFVASITFSEKIVNFQSTSWWAKSLLILCWLFLLLSIVCDGVGLVFVTNWYTNEVIEHSQEHMTMFELAFFCFGFAGISFGLALTSMLAAGIISFVHHKSNDNSITPKGNLIETEIIETDNYNGA
jgi:hypothetical protein